MKNVFGALGAAICLNMVVVGGIWAQTPAGSAAESAGKVAGVRAVASLRTSVASRDAKEGQPVKATLRRAVTLPDGQVLPREAEIEGVVVKVSKHTKALPNGVLVLKFDHVVEKGKPSVPVTAWIAHLNPDGSAAAFEEASAVDRAKQQKEEEDAAKKAPMSTGLPGVFLQVSREGSGTVFSLGGDVYLDRGIEITFLLNGSAP